MTIDDIERAIRDHLPGLAALDGTVKLDLGDAGVLFLDGTGATATLGREDRDADCVIRTSADTVGDLLEGRMKPLFALTFRKVRIDGDRRLVDRLVSLIRDPPSAPAEPEPPEAAPEPSAPAPEPEATASEPEPQPAPADPAAPGNDRQERRPEDSRVVAVHAAVPGRLRVRVFGLRGDRRRAERLERELADRPEVRSVSASATTGRVLLLFDPAEDDERLLAMLRTAAGDATGAPVVNAERRAEATRRSAAPPSHRERPAGAARPWHAMRAVDVLTELAADGRRGLDGAEAARRLEWHGPNTLAESEGRSRLGMLIEQVTSVPIALLGVSAVISVATGGIADAVAILAAVGINAAVGYFTESQAERTIRSLTRRRQHTARVCRDGTATEVAAESVVPGDIIALSSGMFVAADGRLLETDDLTVDESMLTGESLPAGKSAEAELAEDAPLGDRSTMVYGGTVVTGGSGRAVIVATGDATEIGAIRTLVGEAKPPETPMQRQLGDLGRMLAYVSGSVCIAVLGIGLLRGYGFFQMLTASSALAVAAVPEGLPATATTTLALGMRSMRRDRVLVRRLEAVETLGSVGVVCFDKTGTLTVNRMRVSEVRLTGTVFRSRSGDADADPPLVMAGDADDAEEDAARADLERLLEVAALCNEAHRPDGGDDITGSATEAALLRVAERNGIDVSARRRQWPIASIRHRSEAANVMVTHHEASDGTTLTAVKGAPGEVLERCARIRRHGRSEPITDRDLADANADNDTMAAAALRVLGVAYAERKRGEPAKDGDYTWLGLVGMADPLRPGMRELMQTFHRAGIRTVMITGDQSATAYAIARQLDLNQGRQIRILESAELATVDRELLAALSGRADVFARVSPADKLRIVQGLQQSGFVVAMTGDGVNDGPALKAADVGVAMGAAGSDVAHELADIVLEDDDIAVMALAVSRGRTIYGNIRKSLHFLLATNLSEVIVVAAGTALGLGQPLTPMQLLWINLVSDILPGIALSIEAPRRGVLRRPPRDPAAPIVGMRDLGRMATEGAVISGGAMLAYGWGAARYGPGRQAGTMAFLALTAAQLLHALACRSDRRQLGTGERLPANPLLSGAVAGSLAATALAMLIPPARRLLGTVPIGPVDWLVTAAGAVLPFVTLDACKPWLARIGGEAAASPAPPSSAADIERETP